jgi:hypothetical protein
VISFRSSLLPIAFITATRSNSSLTSFIH